MAISETSDSIGIYNGLIINQVSLKQYGLIVSLRILSFVTLVNSPELITMINFSIFQESEASSREDLASVNIN
jgi:hypothetical protein